MTIQIDPTWREQLHSEFEKPYFKELVSFVKKQYATNTIYPPPKLIFNAFNCTPFNRVKVVIIGQDPYHGKGQAHGLSFSVQEGTTIPPSLQNIYKEITSDLERPSPTSGDLSYWPEQGVLLRNATLTVQAKSPGSHQGKGWEEFTDKAIEILSNKRRHVVFLLWGAYAQKKKSLINPDNGHLILTSPHPSPFSANKGFFGSKHFSKTNKFLTDHDFMEIDW